MFLFFLYYLVGNSHVIITEVMSNVKGSENTCGKRNEFVEIYNQSQDTLDLSSYLVFDFDANPDEIFPWNDESLLVRYPRVRINSSVIYPFSYALILDRDYTSSDTAGGNVQPYSFPDSVLILTTDDHTIGDGLTTTDPLIFFSTACSCTTTFGTPCDSLDGFPYDPGDGISWERIELTDSDYVFNWYPSVDPGGCTPGKENSTVNASDLAVDKNLIEFNPSALKVGEDVKIRAGVVNNGLRATNAYALLIFDDQDSDSTSDAGEILTELPGESVSAFDTVFLYYTLEHPVQGDHRIGFSVNFPGDKDLTNNLAMKELRVLGMVGELCLSPMIFTPDGDGSNDRLQIDYRLPESNGELTISVFDSRGTKICDLCKKISVTVDRGTLYWDGEGRDGKAPLGMYIVYLEYKYQSKLAKAKRTTVLAR